jgi:hypothetical protein
MAIDGMMEGEGVLDIRLHRQGQGVGCGFSEAPDISDLDETMAVTADDCDVLTPAPYSWPR